MARKCLICKACRPALPWYADCNEAATLCLEHGHDMDKDPPTVADIEAAISRYLYAHPQATDTERGIREWWLLTACPCHPDDVHAAIEHMVGIGALAERTLPDGQRAYARLADALNPRPRGPH